MILPIALVNSRNYAPLLVIPLLLALSARAQDEQPLDSSTPAARVNGRDVTVGDVELHLRRALTNQQVDAAIVARLRYETLRKLVDRELVLSMLEARKIAASTQDVELGIARLTEELTARGRTLEEYLQQQQMDEQQLRTTLRWTISWGRMLDEFMTDENLERYFIAHRRDFDGTKMRVAHILLKADPKEQSTAVEKARKIREEIDSGALSFSEAAQKYSQAPTAAQGGDIGWIERHLPMPESFTREAFQLEVQQIGGPVATKYGVHLIQCLEIEPGNRQWRDVRKELEPMVAQYLFRWAADKQRDTAQIEWLGVINEQAAPAASSNE